MRSGWMVFTKGLRPKKIVSEMQRGKGVISARDWKITGQSGVLLYPPNTRLLKFILCLLLQVGGVALIQLLKSVGVF